MTTVLNEQYYDSLDKYAKAEDFVVYNEDYVDRSSVVVADEELFRHEEIETIVKSCPNGKTCGIDGVSYEDVKAAWDDHGDILVDFIGTVTIISERTAADSFLGIWQYTSC